MTAQGLGAGLSGGRGRPPGRPPAGPGLGLLGLAFLVGLALTVWAGGELSGWLAHGHWPPVPASDAGGVLIRLLGDPRHPALAWSRRLRPYLAPPAALYGVSAGLLAIASAAGVVVARALTGAGTAMALRPGHNRLSRVRSLVARGGASLGSNSDDGAWARSADLRPLTVNRPQPGRLTLGWSGRRLLAAEPAQSVIVIGPTQSRKTSGFALPALLEWAGPALATSVKSDLIRDSRRWRESQGNVWIYDPAGSTGLPSASWSPLDRCRDWSGARRTAAALCSSARTPADTLADGDFWYATAAKLLAPLLLAASRSGLSMGDVVTWVDTQEMEQVADALDALGEPEALRAALATWRREERQRSSVYTTAETVLEAFADPAVAALSRRSEVSAEILLDGGSHTLYVCGPSSEQKRLRSLFASLLDEVIATAYKKVTETGRRLDPPLLVVLDEAAHIAPLADLDALAATAAGHGVQLVTVWQDMAQVTSRYGARSATVVNNHRAKVVLSGISDPTTLDHVSALVGEVERGVASTTTDSLGAVSTTTSTSHRSLAPAAALRRIQPGQGVLVYGHLAPARIRLRPWHDDSDLAARAAGAGPGASVPKRTKR